MEQKNAERLMISTVELIVKIMTIKFRVSKKKNKTQLKVKDKRTGEEKGEK